MCIHALTTVMSMTYSGTAFPSAGSPWVRSPLPSRWGSAGGWTCWKPQPLQGSGSPCRRPYIPVRRADVCCPRPGSHRCPWPPPVTASGHRSGQNSAAFGWNNYLSKLAASTLVTSGIMHSQRRHFQPKTYSYLNWKHEPEEQIHVV